MADEPTGDLDAKSAGEILDLLERLNEEFDKTIIMVTHDPRAAERATRLLHLEKGVLVDGQPAARTREATHEVAQVHLAERRPATSCARA